jgi:hypothetical protein
MNKIQQNALGLFHYITKFHLHVSADVDHPQGELL